MSLPEVFRGHFFNSKEPVQSSSRSCFWCINLQSLQFNQLSIDTMLHSVVGLSFILDVWDSKKWPALSATKRRARSSSGYFVSSFICSGVAKLARKFKNKCIFAQFKPHNLRRSQKQDVKLYMRNKIQDIFIKVAIALLLLFETVFKSLRNIIARTTFIIQKCILQMNDWGLTISTFFACLWLDSHEFFPSQSAWMNELSSREVLKVSNDGAVNVSARVFYDWRPGFLNTHQARGSWRRKPFLHTFLQFIDR